MNTVLSTLTLVNEIIGKPGPVALDTNILRKSYDHGPKDAAIDRANRVAMGIAGKNITLEDLYATISYINSRRDFRKEIYDSGSTYIFRGFSSTGPGVYTINWDS